MIVQQMGFIQGIQGWFNISKSVMIHHINKLNKESYDCPTDGIYSRDSRMVQHQQISYDTPH